jgi:hypothetical protein
VAAEDAAIPKLFPPPEPTMNLNTFDSLLQRAVNLGLALVVTLGMLGGIDSLAQAPQHEPATMATTSSNHG